MPRYFIIGTDTDCGKTYVTCQLLKHLNQSHQQALAIKPIASGGRGDIDALNQYQDPGTHSIYRWLFEPAIAPHLAAEQANQMISFEQLDTFCDIKQDSKHPNTQTLLIESAGGLMCPLNTTSTWLDYLEHSKIPVILVVGMKLGCINHALLTQLALQTRHIKCRGWIANCVDLNMQVLKKNIGTLEHKLEYPRLATLEFNGTMPPNFCLPID
ncbi:MAG: dethiobiotin synthase [Legionellaceae bacterium]|nr:dethiobiotin synthase [Legionellaceae bacterium]